jgi:hypothetical protein
MSKKIPVKLLLRSKPVAQVETSVGRIYLYPLRVRDMTDFEQLETEDALTQLRNFLTSIASLTMESDETLERISLDREIAKRLSDDEVEQLAEIYVKSAEWQTVRDGYQEYKPLSRREGEAASAYLIRLVQNKIEQKHQTAKQLQEKLLGSSRGIFDQVRESTSALSSTLSAFEHLTKTPSQGSQEIHPVPINHLTGVQDLLAQQARERAEDRAEEMELTRLTGQMTAASATALKDLVDAATTMMEQMDKRDEKTDESTFKQIRIALWSVVLSAILAFIAAIFSGLSYFQDQNNNTAGDQWQASMLTAIKQGNQYRFTLEQENQSLLEQVKSQDQRIAGLEAERQTKTKKNSKTTNALQQSRKPVRTPGLH